MIIDAHIHTGKLYSQYVFDPSLEKLLETMDFLGIAKAISSNFLWLNLTEMRRGMEQAEKEYESSGGRIHSFLYFDPRIGAKCIDVYQKYFNPQIFKGIKLHPSWSRTSADDEGYRMIWEFAQKMKLPILSHSWDISPTNPIQFYSHPARFERYLSEFGGVKFVFAHSGGRYHAIQWVAGLARKYGNIYCDIAGDIHANGFLEYLVGEIGSSRIIFGSDYNMMDQRTMLGVVAGAAISARAKEDILYRTACQVYFEE